MEEKYKEVAYEGILVTNYGEKFYLMYGQPIDKDMWMTDDVKMFLGVAEFGRPVHIVVSGFTLFPEARGTVKIRKEEAESQDIPEPEWLKRLLQEEPQALAE